MTDPLLLECDGTVWRVTLNRPLQGNSCSTDLVAALDDTLVRATQERAQALVLRGAGKHFCTGFDLSAVAQETDDTLLAQFVRIELMLQRLARAPFLTVAIAHGRATGAGADIFTACAMRLVQGEASLAFPGARGFGLVLGTRRLCELVGRQTALSWIESATVVTAAEATRTGLATGAMGADTALDQLISERTSIDATLREALQRAAQPHRDFEDALDLKRLVESAARPGLRDRIASYIESIAHKPSLPLSNPPA